MFRPPLDSRNRPALEQPSWGSLLAGYALVPAVFLTLWALSRPVTATAVLVATLGLFLAVRRVARVIRCYRDCGGFSLDLGGRVRVTITQSHLDDSR